ncbi:winged helix-turn-helix transcriptional regulator [Corynebacterium sp. zg-331]|uniref:ArsR/SmtB family transcription factor n=1 Tax=unclassified Corynebacterium TaxID=2624378 RepID=UPI00128B141D|nr:MULTISPECIES: helix-turn-helix domain-containing protein [unclassified Corynebacterium]MBC3185288.1 winged helix-turn-helix transcriptional regulator [Corynebacterium sp. zg-331]MPV51785.1 helix-turn-helix domain-containing protein [Corynebacterium sp. zg331]
MASRLSRPLAIPAEEELDLFAIMAALADPTRRAIVAHIAATPGGACASAEFGVTKSALTRHWRILREAGLIRQKADGTRHRNWLRTEELDRRFPGLIHMVLTEIDRTPTTVEEGYKA